MKQPNIGLVINLSNSNLYLLIFIYYLQLVIELAYERCLYCTSCSRFSLFTAMTHYVRETTCICSRPKIVRTAHESYLMSPSYAVATRIDFLLRKARTTLQTRKLMRVAAALDNAVN